MLKEPTDNRTCQNCKYNIIKIIVNKKFKDGSPCTGVCGNFNNTDVYYNSIFLTCDAWEQKEDGGNS